MFFVTKNKKIIYIFVSLFVSCFFLYQQSISQISDDLIKSKRNIGLYEINSIEFSGNIEWSSQELLLYLTSRATERSIPNKILTTYYNEAKKNNYTPDIYVEELGIGLSQFNKEYSYFNEEIVLADISVLLNLYYVNGFHYTDINYSFQRVGNGNVLTFNILEGNRFKLASKITHKGLEELPTDIKSRIENLKLLKAGDFFNEEQIEQEVSSINNLLFRSGYMDARCSYSDVNITIDSLTNTDSVVVYWTLGNRISIGNIKFVDSTYNQKKIANSTKEKLIRIKTGDYYNNIRIERSIDNLLSTGVFESVTIDTVSKNYTNNDTVRDFLILSKYRNLRDWEWSPVFNQTQFDGIYNIGIDGYFLHRNMFGSAQNVKLYSTILLKDIPRAISTLTVPDLEFRVEGQYSQPMLWAIEDVRVAISASLAYSYEVLNALFRISKISFPISFPARLPWGNYFSNINVQLDINREVPINYNEIVNTALDSAITSQDSINIQSSLTLYRNINNYLKEPQTHIFTSNLISIDITGDDRDNLFSPTTGSMTFFGIDGYNPIFALDLISGAAKYFRLQALHTHFWKLSNSSVLGIKGKAGWTYLFNDSNAFVPQDRQFFAGGANSVRAWPVRQLRYYTQTTNFGNNAIDEFSKNYIGSKTLIEGSIELRQKLGIIPGVSESLAWLFNDLSIGLFIDIGNTFGWYANDETQFKFTDYFTKLAIGTGFGIRYDTPIGPIRLDFGTPIYDPTKQRKPFNDIVLQFGIGHAF